MNIYVHAPIIDGSELRRDELFGSKDVERDLPALTQNYSERRQEDQGYTNKCTIYTTAEVFENKVFKETGRWYRFPKHEIDRIWVKMKKMGLANDSWGAYLNAPVKALEGDPVIMEDSVSGDKLKVILNDWFIVANKADDPEAFAKKTMYEVAYGGGVITGVHTTMTKLDYYGANKKPYIVKERANPKEIAHAVNLTSYNFERAPGLVDSAGTWGDQFGDDGVVYFQTGDLRKLFTPIGWTFNIE